jgi:lactate racemase
MVKMNAISSSKKEVPAMYQLRYGSTTLSLQLPSENPVDLLTYRMEGTSTTPGEARAKIRQALDTPIGSPKLSELARGHRQVVILISDGTRLVPTSMLLGPLLSDLNQAGVTDEQIDIIIALGLHRKHTPQEIEQLVGSDVYQRIRVHNHSAVEEDCRHVGTTSHGTPIEINKLVADASLRIATGNIEPHALVGISGGAKALVPGVASQRCIEHNHAMSLKHKASPGDPNNPIHQDLEEALQFVPIQFLLNVIVDIDRNILEAVAGHVIAAHRHGVALSAQRFVIPVERQYDLIVASPGGYPKDTQMYQTIKAIKNACAFTKPDGTVLMAAECSELLGNGIFQYWVETKRDREQMVRMLKEQFVMGAHKMLHIDEILSKHHVRLYSSLPEYLTGLLGFHPVADLQHEILSYLKPSHSIAVMPYASLTFAGG